MDLFEELWKLASAQLDVLLVVGIVVLIQFAKKNFPRVPKKAWAIVMVLLGFVAAWISTPRVPDDLKGFFRKGIVYSAGAEFVYQMYRTLMETARARVKGRK